MFTKKEALLCAVWWLVWLGAGVYIGNASAQTDGRAANSRKVQLDVGGMFCESNLVIYSIEYADHIRLEFLDLETAVGLYHDLRAADVDPRMRVEVDLCPKALEPEQ